MTILLSLVIFLKLCYIQKLTESRIRALCLYQDVQAVCIANFTRQNFLSETSCVKCNVFAQKAYQPVFKQTDLLSKYIFSSSLEKLRLHSYV
jgi:hypothetical protein